MKTTIDWITTAFQRVVAFVPNLIAGLIILLFGWIVAAVLARVTRAVARRLGFDRLVARLGSAPTEPGASSRWLGSAVYIVIMLATVMQATRAWRLDFVANGLAAIIAYLPHAIAAAVVFGAALLIGNWVRDRLFRPRAAAEPVTGAAGAGGIESLAPRILPGLVRAAIIAVGAFMALRELQIGAEIVNAAFILSLGALAVATALAFGLGAREVAGRVAQSWWERRTFFGTPAPGTPPRVGVSA